MNNMWRSVARYARQKIVQHDPEQLEEILQLWYLRLLALTKLGLYQLASAELDKLGDLKRPELTYQYHADLYPNKHGCMVPFELRVLWACLPALMKHPLLTLERITMLAVHCKKMQKTDASQVNIWQRREVQMYLVLSTRFMEMNDYTGAASTMEMILDKYATAENGEQDIDILSGLARLYLQLGDISSAQNLYTRLESQYQGNDAPSVTECIQINRALLCIAKADWKQARDILLEIYQTNKENLLVMHNLAVCEVYMGNLNKAIAILETLTTDNPTSAGTCETALMNMCTLYELRYANPTDKKVAVMKQVARWIGDSFQSNCFKLQ
ncbi:uncharacterized protein BYT42DRAFT_491015 [Radiomyces spectabilis]|uniref:uncharacterized protein n=1 Tax=Radiomyces spectabilis TaxID=64574 RepID=UPI00221EE6FC|nr:uncharacterized protein BYT42DRAFT_491015 [Radiomyces spectabilis]KAI8388738.1 hypothetical protein BYT42DRAFT_491015 [Radiomyces spectabilis]